MKSEKIVIICQGSANEQFTKETEYLFRSINEYGGKLANAEKIACFSEPVSDETILSLEKIGVKTKLIESIDTRCIHANKIQTLKLFEEEFDVLIVLDTDIIVLNDFSNLK